MAESKSPPPSNQPEVAQQSPAPAVPAAEASPQPPSQPQEEAQTQTPAQASPSQEPSGSPSEQQPAEQSAPDSKPEATKTPAPLAPGDDQAEPTNDNAEEKEDKEDITMGGTEENGGNAAEGPTANGAPPATNAQPVDANELNSFVPPTKKDTSLREFLGQMDEYAPIIPDAVTAHYLTVAGLPPPGPGPNHTPPHLARLLALATQKFIADIAADAYQYSRIRSSNSASSNNPMGSINVTAGLSNAANQAGGGAGGASTSTGGASGGAAGAGGGDNTAKGKANAAAGLHLGVQRSGFGGGGHGGTQGKTVLTMEDLGMAVAEYGVSIKRGEFYR